VSEDGARTALHQVTILKNEGNGRDAKALATKALVKYADFQGAELLRAVAGVSGSTPVR